MNDRSFEGRKDLLILPVAGIFKTWDQDDIRGVQHFAESNERKKQVAVAFKQSKQMMGNKSE